MKALYKMLIVCVLVTALAASWSGCTTAPAGQITLTIFHAESLSKPFDEVAEAFMKEHPNVAVQRESSGSVEAVKKISELNKTADILATSDWLVVNQFLYPKLTNWIGKFASNEMVVTFTNNSSFASEINATNWYQILTNPDVAVGRTNPNADPSGYQTLMVWKLAQKFYNNDTLYNALSTNAAEKHVRQKEVDLTASLKSGEIDYAWDYLSVAKQNKLNYVTLPSQINLSNKTYASYYQTVNVSAAGQQVNGSLIEYGITIPHIADDPAVAEEFIAFTLGPQGSAIMAANDQPTLKPMGAVGQLPLLLVPFTLANITATTSTPPTTAPVTATSAPSGPELSQAQLSAIQNDMKAKGYNIAQALKRSGGIGASAVGSTFYKGAITKDSIQYNLTVEACKDNATADSQFSLAVNNLQKLGIVGSYNSKTQWSGVTTFKGIQVSASATKRATPPYTVITIE